MTPPYDVRPGFQGDYKLLQDTLTSQWGEQATTLFPSDQLLLINKAPGEDTVLECIRGGIVLGTLLYEDHRWRFKPRKAALAHLQHPERGYLEIAEDAVPFLADRRNALRPGVDCWSDDIKHGDCSIQACHTLCQSRRYAELLVFAYRGAHAAFCRTF